MIIRLPGQVGLAELLASVQLADRPARFRLRVVCPGCLLGPRDPDSRSWGSCVVYVKRKGRIERVADRLFEGEEAVLHVIERIVAPLGLRVDATSPWVDARLPDGSRVHAIVPPLSLCGPCRERA